MSWDLPQQAVRKKVKTDYICIKFANIRQIRNIWSIKTFKVRDP